MASNFNPSDIEIFVTTYNRSALLKETLESVVNQTIKGVAITVLDNASSDDTAGVVKSFEGFGVRYNRAPINQGWFANMQRAQNLAATGYTMVLHDDDLIHPQYVERMLEGLNRFPNIVLATSCFTPFGNQVLANHEQRAVLFRKELRRKYFFLEDNPAAFAASLFCASSLSTVSGTIAKREIFKGLDYKALYNTFGKNMDWMYMTEIASKGNALILEDTSALLYRLHEGQDTNNNETGTTVEQMLNVGRFFYDTLARQGSSAKYYNIYNRSIVNALRYNYEHFLSKSQRALAPFATHLENMCAKEELTKDAFYYAKRKVGLLNRLRSLGVKFARRKNLSDKVVDLSA